MGWMIWKRNLWMAGEYALPGHWGPMRVYAVKVGGG